MKLKACKLVTGHFFCILYDKSRDRSYFYYKFQYPHLVLRGRYFSAGRRNPYETQ